MPNNIKLMPEGLSLKIAAGEVVERPASVVKEAVENSIDAGATEIGVHVNEAGRRLIKVVDNGCGITREDCGLLFRRHATSKISAEEDLSYIKTMGFRGEALSSIASVAKVTLISRPPSSAVGTRVTVDGGGVPVIADEGCPVGTTLEIKDLFYNTPARLKFLKTNSAEFGRITDTVKRISIINPAVRFKLFHGSSKVIDAKKGGLKERVADIFGAEILRELLEVKEESEKISVRGFIGRPELSYAAGKGFFTYVNSRPIYDRSINRAIMDGYSGMLDGGRYPFSIVDIRIAPDCVDVNVHPAKSEVRFRDTSFVFDAVKSAVKNALRNYGVFKEKAGALTKGFSSPDAASGKAAFPDKGVKEYVMPWGGETEAFSFQKKEEFQSPQFLAMEVLGQLWGEFLIVEDKDGFFIIDQHAASERVRFEELKKRYYRGPGIGSQYLLAPERFPAGPKERDALSSSMPYLKKLGFEIVPFGQSFSGGEETFLIKAVPDILSGSGNARLVKDLVEELSHYDVSSKVEKNIEAALATIACHSVIRGRRPLTKEEALSLLNDMARVDFSSFCPHGRPAVKRFTREEVEMMFKRR